MGPTSTCFKQDLSCRKFFSQDFFGPRAADHFGGSRNYLKIKCAAGFYNAVRRRYAGRRGGVGYVLLGHNPSIPFDVLADRRRPLRSNASSVLSSQPVRRGFQYKAWRNGRCCDRRSLVTYCGCASSHSRASAGPPATSGMACSPRHRAPRWSLPPSSRRPRRRQPI